MYNKPTEPYPAYNTGVARRQEQPLPELTYPLFNPPTGVFTAPPEKASPLFDPIARDTARIEKGQSSLFDPWETRDTIAGHQFGRPPVGHANRRRL
ncbi:hypothetical protein HK101_009083 [Irineochytrium annulatum]|nr:hypothetical protein HK101_009083 [Irineochytrium annulatum]